MATLRAGRLRITLAQHLETCCGVPWHSLFMSVQSRFVSPAVVDRDFTWRPADEGWGGRFIRSRIRTSTLFLFVGQEAAAAGPGINESLCFPGSSAYLRWHFVELNKRSKTMPCNM